MNSILKIAICLTVMINKCMSDQILNVNNIPELQLAISSAKTGDTIILKDGIYSDDFSLTLKASGVKVQAQTLGGVKLTGGASFTIKSNGNTFSGFQFIGGSNVNPVEYAWGSFGNNNTITQCNFFNLMAKFYVYVAADRYYNMISYCNFENKPANAPGGPTLKLATSIGGSHHRVSYCTFQNFPGGGGDFGNEPIRLGGGEFFTTSFQPVMRAIVEYSYWKNTSLGDDESISIKSNENIIRYNVFENNPGGMVKFRMGDANIVHSNFFIKGSGGISIKEASNALIFNNYFDGTNGYTKRYKKKMLDRYFILFYGKIKQIVLNTQRLEC